MPAVPTVRAVLVQAAVLAAGAAETATVPPRGILAALDHLGSRVWLEAAVTC